MCSESWRTCRSTARDLAAARGCRSRPTCIAATSNRFGSRLSARADILAFNVGLHVAHRRARHPAPGGDGRGVVAQTVEAEVAGHIDVELPATLQAPFQR